MIRSLLVVSFALIAIAVASSTASAQQIVTDPALDARLVAFEANFPAYVAAHPELTSGVTGPVHLEGKKGKVSVEYTMRGSYMVVYGALEFAPTTPMSASRFEMSLAIESITLSGGSELTITKTSNTYDLACPNNTITVPALVFTAEVEVSPSGTLQLTSPATDLDPRDVTVVVPCLEGGQSGVAADASSVLGVLETRLAETLARDLTSGRRPPSRGVLDKAKRGLQGSAIEPSSDAVTSATETAGTMGRVVAASGASPCGDTVRGDVALVAADLAAIADQAAAQGFPEAIELFAADLRALAPTLDRPSEQAVTTFAAALEAAVDENGPGGTTITPLEQATLTNELYGVVLSTGISAADLQRLYGELAAAVATLDGISTESLRVHGAQLVEDARACLER